MAWQFINKFNADQKLRIGAIFAVVKATLDRKGAQAFEKVTGVWPGD